MFYIFYNILFFFFICTFYYLCIYIYIYILLLLFYTLPISKTCNLKTFIHLFYNSKKNKTGFYIKE